MYNSPFEVHIETNDKTMKRRSSDVLEQFWDTPFGTKTWMMFTILTSLISRRKRHTKNDERNSEKKQETEREKEGERIYRTMKIEYLQTFPLKCFWTKMIQISLEKREND